MLGELAVLREGRPVTLPASRKTRALLGFLATEGRQERRERLCDLFWDAPDDPRGSLRWSLSKLRPIVDDASGPRLRADRDHVALALAKDARVDLLHARVVVGRSMTASTAELASAARLFRGEPLSGLDLTGCPRFYSWLLATRADARRTHVAILSALIDRADIAADDAVAHARALVDIDPLAQASHVRVVRLLSRLGRTAEAREQFDLSVRILRELGQAPGPELAAAHVALGVAAPTRAAPSPPRPATPEPATKAGTPLIGRDVELDRLRALVDSAQTGVAPGLALLAGDPGIGKSRLLDELARHARGRGVTVLVGRAFQPEMVRPYGPWIDALRSVSLAGVPADVMAPLAGLLPELGAAPDEDANRARLFDGVGRVLTALAGAERDTGAGAGGGALIVLDDLQWSDEASLALLHYIARSPWPGRIVLAAAVRAGEVADNPAALRVLRALDRDGRLTRLELSPLSAAEIASLVRHAPSPVDAARVFAESGGNPLFAIEVAAALGRGKDALSETLDGLIGDRLDRLGDSARAFVPWAAAIGCAFTPETLARVAGRDVTEAIAALDELERMAIVRAAASGDALPSPAAYDFSHDIVREAAYRTLSPPRRRALHLQIARVMQSQDDAHGARASEIALHAARGGDLALAARTCIRAGERCVRLFAFRDAVDLADRGLAYTAELPASLALPLRVRLLGLQVQPGLGPVRLRALRADHLALVESLGEAELIDDLHLCFAQLVRLEYLSGDFTGLHAQVARGAQAPRTTDVRAAARSLAASGACLAWLEQDLPRAHALLTESQELARQADVRLPDLEVGLGLLQFHAGNEAASVARLEAAVRLAQAERDPWIAYTALLQLVTIDIERGRTADARQRFPLLRRLASTFGHNSEEPVVESLMCLIDILDGNAAAETRIPDAVAALRAHDHKRMLAFVLATLAERAIAAAHPNRAQPLVEEALTVADALGRRSELLKARLIALRLADARGDDGQVKALLSAVNSDLNAPGGAAAHLRAEAVRLTRRMTRQSIKA